MFDVFNKIIIEDKKICKTWNCFWSNYPMNTRKSLKIYNVRVRFYGTNSIQDKETQQVEYFDQIILIQRKNYFTFRQVFQLFTLQFSLKAKILQGMKRFWWTCFYENNITL